MRPSLLPGLLTAAQRNADRGFGDVALFEVGPGVHGRRAEATSASRPPPCAAAPRKPTAPAVTGRRKAATVDVFDAKADAMALLAALGVPLGGLQVVPGGPDLAASRPLRRRCSSGPRP